MLVCTSLKFLSPVAVPSTHLTSMSQWMVSEWLSIYFFTFCYHLCACSFASISPVCSVVDAPFVLACNFQCCSILFCKLLAFFEISTWTVLLTKITVWIVKGGTSFVEWLILPSSNRNMFESLARPVLLTNVVVWGWNFAPCNINALYVHVGVLRTICEMVHTWNVSC